MKRCMVFLLTALLLCASAALAAPELTGVFADDVMLISGQDGWYFDFHTTEGGSLALQLLSGQTGEAVCDLGATQVEAGSGRIAWNGLLPDGTAVAPGSYMVAVQLRNYWGEESGQSLLSLHIYASEEEAAANVLDLSTLVAEEAIPWEEETAQSSASAQDTAVPAATSFWDMDPDAYDLDNPEHQQAIWDLMMQPITVLDVGQTEHVYPTNQPGIDRTPYEENCAGELHGQSQGVHVLEEDTDGDGYVLIEAYSNDGTKTDNTYMESLDAKKIQGYVRENLLFEVTPSDRYAILVDKLRQRLYLFEEGRIISTLVVSTGLNNENQPYNETPAGEFITVSRVGDFDAGGGTIGRYAIRINGGTLLHEVLHTPNADGTRVYSPYEQQLGQKASHGCIRIQRRENENGHNMAWLWSNLELKTKVFIWDDQGRQMYEPEVPDPQLQLYRNPNGGSNYHLDANCSGVRDQYLPLTGDFTYGDLNEDPFKNLTPCPYCAAPERLETLYEQYMAAAEQIDAEVPENVRALFGLE
ncbi:MAG TPA: L,D-transpeptidase family protein [Candidatus Ventricola intestinavium]|nr:L,D-transpeptidase family protein [Candidatus Ventricola intestinavium]